MEVDADMDSDLLEPIDDDIWKEHIRMAETAEHQYFVRKQLQMTRGPFQSPRLNEEFKTLGVISVERPIKGETNNGNSYTRLGRLAQDNHCITTTKNAKEDVRVLMENIESSKGSCRLVESISYSNTKMNTIYNTFVIKEKSSAFRTNDRKPEGAPANARSANGSLCQHFCLPEPKQIQTTQMHKNDEPPNSNDTFGVPQITVTPERKDTTKPDAVRSNMDTTNCRESQLSANIKAEATRNNDTEEEVNERFKKYFRDNMSSEELRYMRRVVVLTPLCKKNKSHVNPSGKEDQNRISDRATEKDSNEGDTEKEGKRKRDED